MGIKVKTLVNEFSPSGDFTVTWYGFNQQGIKGSTGIYIYILMLDGRIIEKKKMLLIK